MKEYSIDDYVAYRIAKSNETIHEVETLIENEYWNTAINRMYYACFYAVGALLVKNGIQTNSIVVCVSNSVNCLSAQAK